MTTGREDCLLAVYRFTRDDVLSGKAANLDCHLKGEITWYDSDHASVFAHEAGECRFVGTVARKSDDIWSAGVTRHSLPVAFDNPEDAATALLAMARGA